MIKTRKDFLEEIYNETLKQVVDSEIKISLLKKRKPDDVIFAKVEKRPGLAMPITRNYTAKMLLDKEENERNSKLNTLGAIQDMLKEEEPKTQPNGTDASTTNI